MARSNDVGILDEVRIASRAFVFAGESVSLRTVLRDALHASLKYARSDLVYSMSIR